MPLFHKARIPLRYRISLRHDQPEQSFLTTPSSQNGARMDDLSPVQEQFIT